LSGRKSGALTVTLKQGFFIVRPLACLFLCLAAAACAPGHGLPALPPVESGAYRLGVGDVVRLITVGDDTLTGEFQVGASGKVALPLLGEMQASGQTPDVLAVEIRQALVKGNLYNAPSVSVEVTTYRPIFVLGEVSKPGQYPYQPGMTVVTAAAVAGGFTYRAIDDYASVVRTRDGVAMEGKATRQTFIQPGDVITIYERRF
jgi:polysaccharide export outer membrane protein